MITIIEKRETKLVSIGLSEKEHTLLNDTAAVDQQTEEQFLRAAAMDYLRERGRVQQLS